MQSVYSLFGESPFGRLVEHARKVHACVALVKPVAEAIVRGDMESLNRLQDDISRAESEADALKDQIRAALPSRYFLPVNRTDMSAFLRQLDRMADDAQDFAVIATFRRIALPENLRGDFLGLVGKVVEVSEALLGLAEHLAQLQKESFAGPDAEKVLAKLEPISRMEWEADKLNRRFARKYYADPDLDVKSLILLDKMCRTLGGVADHAENVAKNLRLMIVRS